MITGGLVLPLPFHIELQNIQQDLKQVGQARSQGPVVAHHHHMGEIGIMKLKDLAQGGVFPVIGIFVDDETAGAVPHLKTIARLKQLQVLVRMEPVVDERPCHLVLCRDAPGMGQKGKGGVGDVDGVADHRFTEIQQVLQAPAADYRLLHLLNPLVDAEKDILNLGEQLLQLHVLIDDDGVGQQLLRLQSVLHPVPQTDIADAGHAGRRPDKFRQPADIQPVRGQRPAVPGQQGSAVEGLSAGQGDVHLVLMPGNAVQQDIQRYIHGNASQLPRFWWKLQYYFLL